jgi:hypothetical protein
MVELAGWPKWVDPPYWPSFHVIYWWAFLVLGVGGYETYRKGERREAWAEYWQERGRTLGGNVEEICLVLLGGRVGGGRPSSPDRIAAGILQQIVHVVCHLTKPGQGVHVMACLLVPVTSKSGASTVVVALQAIAYNENAGRNFSVIDIDDPGPATEAFRSGVPKIVPDTGVEAYHDQFAGRPYRSVMAYPVRVGGASGHRLAVVTIDATEAGHFREEDRITKGIDAAIFPLLKLIALARVAELRGGRRGPNSIT